MIEAIAIIAGGLCVILLCVLGKTLYEAAESERDLRNALRNTIKSARELEDKNDALIAQLNRVYEQLDTLISEREGYAG